ncbi:FecR family protein [Brucellaceae bacterium C25G]
MKITAPSWQEMDKLENSLDPAVREAIEWMFRLEDENVDAVQKQTFSDWISADERHAAAYREAEKLWSAASLLSEKSEPSSTLTRRKLLLGLAAGVISYQAWRFYAPPNADFETAKGELITVSLPDGSEVNMSSATSLALEFTQKRRLVHLLSGEAFFTVSSDSSRPFVVKAGVGEVQALGTAYSVHLDKDTVNVTVAEHSVIVRHPLGEIRLESGMTLDYNKDNLSEARPADLEIALSWRNGKLIFVNKPLEQVLAEIGRWQKGRIILANRSLASQPVTAIFDLNSGVDILPQLISSVSARSFSATPYLTIIY